MNKSELCKSLVIWLNTFNLKTEVKKEEELCDGVILATVLHQIAPNHFDESWQSKIKPDTNSNWRLKVSNLKKVLKGIVDYYTNVLDQPLQDSFLPDVTEIGEQSETSEELGRLLQLVLGCAVNCDDKQKHITTIMGLEESVQQMVMEAIQELMRREPASPRDGENRLGNSEQLRKLTEDLEKEQEEKEEMAQRCHQLDQQIAHLLEEKTLLESENERLTERLNQADSLDDPTTPAGRRFHQLQVQVDSMQEELFKSEAVKDDFRIKVELQGKELLELQQKNEELLQLASKAQSYKDEADVLRHTADKVIKYETQLESYRKKLEELSDLKGQIKILEEKNTSYVNTNMELEEEVRRLGSFKSQLELYKRQVQELQTTCSEETRRADKAEFEAKRSVAKMEGLQREKEHLLEENTSLKDSVEELKGLSAQKDNMAHSDGLENSGLVNIMSLPPDVKEKLLRLERENKQLKLATSPSEDSAVLQSMLDDANTRKQELEQENRQLNQRLLELGAQLEDLTEQQSRGESGAAGADLKRHLAEQQTRATKLESQLTQTSAQLEEATQRENEVRSKVKELETSLGKQQREMQEMEKRYKQYLYKAKEALKSASDSANNKTTGPEILALKNQLTERDQLVKHMEKEQEKNKNIRDNEEKLMVTAWYNLSMQMHRCAVEERLRNTGAGQSFLARQRQARTTTPMGHASHTNSSTGR